jgi:hypothetical protein
MSLYNKTFFFEFMKNDTNKLFLSKLKKFREIDITNVNKVLEVMKLNKDSVKKIHLLLQNDNNDAIINIEKKKIKFFTAKCFDKFETDYKGSVSFTTDTFINETNENSFNALLNNEFFKCKSDNFYKRIIIMTNIYNMDFLNFSATNYSGRSFYRYIMTKMLLGDDYDPVMIVKNFDKHHGFYKDGTLGQEIIFYFIEIYCYDRYNFFNNLSNEQYLLVDPHNKNSKDEKEEKNNKINELLINKMWRSEYPSIDGVIYVDKSNDNGKEIIGIETVVFIPDIYLTKIDDIYINDGINFKSDLKDVVSKNPDQLRINFNSLSCMLKTLNSPTQIMIGGYHKKYLKYKNKYLSLKKIKQ